MARQTAAVRMLLVHSPLVGPATMRPLAAVFGAAGVDAIAPDLRAALGMPRPQWQAIVDLAARAVHGSVDVLIGHSGAGALLPLLADRLDTDVTVYVDAVVPGDDAHHVSTAGFLELLDRLPREADDPLLPRWDTWWGPDTMTRLVPDDTLRAGLVDEMPRLPRAFYDDPVPLPQGWTGRHRCCFLQLGPAYDDERARAVALGWPTDRIDGAHLDIAVRPTEVADRVRALIEQARRG